MPQLGEKQIIEGRYWNCGGNGIAIVAVITHDIDWAAYIGTDPGWEKEACLQWVTQNGAKLSREDALHFFPKIELPYRH